MKKITLCLLSLVAAPLVFAQSAAASDLIVAATMQRCTTNQECTLVTASCSDSCGVVPVHQSNLPALQSQYQARCGKAMEANPPCNMTPPLSSACVNARCTIGNAYESNAAPADYQSGAYAVPEAPVPSRVPAEAYSNVDDRHGFTAYNLPQNKVHEGTVGTIHTTVYVPPSAPVSGGNYVPVTAGAVAATPHQAPAVPATPPAYVPTQQPAPPPVAPTYVPPVAPSAHSDIPVMTPSVPNQLPSGASVETYEPAAPYQYVAPETIVTAPPVPTPPPVPVAPPGSVPIPPSDLKPLPTFVPPPGGTIPVNPEDPGAPPPKGSQIMLKDGNLGMTIGGEETDAAKSFTATAPSETNARKLGSYN